MIQIMQMIQMTKIIPMIQMNSYSCGVIFCLVSLERFHYFNEQLIQINNYLCAALFLFGNLQISNYLSDFIFLIKTTSMLF